MSNYAIRKRPSCHVSQGDNVPSENYQRTSLAQALNNFKDCFRKWSVHNQLSVTIVNNEILTSSLTKNSSTKTKDLSYYTFQKEKFQHNLKQMYCKDYIETMIPDSTLGGVPETDCLSQDWHIVDDSNSVKIRNDVNLIKNSDTYEDTSTAESHSMLHINTEKQKKTMDNMTDASGPSDIDPQKFQVDIYKDTDVESFLVVSHSDVPVAPVKKNAMSYFSKCLKVWNSFASRIYCKTQLARMSRKRPYLAKQQHRRKANAIAMGRGRGRAKCQLRRSGVSQTICRKECIKNEDYEIWQNNLLGTAPNDCSLNSKLDSLDNVDIPDLAQMKKQFDSLSISSFPEATTKGRKLKARKKKKTKTKYVTKVRYIAKSSRINNRDYCTDNKNEMSNAEQDSSRSRTLSEYFADTEDDWIVFEDDNDDEELSETREKQGATEYPYVSISLIRKNDSSCDYSNNETRAKKISVRLRSSSESSTDSEDINYSSAVSNQHVAMKCPRIHDCLTKVSARPRQDFNNQMQKDSFRHCRLLSDSSETSDGSNISDSDNSNSSFATEENDDLNSYDERTFHAGDSQDDSIIFANEDSEELTAYISDSFHISDTDNSNSSFATEGNDDVDGYDKINFHDEGSQNSIIFADGGSETLTAPTKKVYKNSQY